MQRTISVNDLQYILPACFESNVTPLLLGAPGIGKSAVLKHFANKIMNSKCFVLSVNQLGSREDLTGARTQLDKNTNTYKQVFFPHALIQDCIDYAQSHPNETPLLFLDEINRTTTDVTGAVMALITERRIGTTNLPDNVRLVAAGNDKGNITVLDDASISRTLVLHLEPDIKEFFNANPNLNHYVKTLLQQNSKLLTAKAITDDDDDEDNSFDFLDDDSFKQITTPRTWTYTSDLLNSLGFDGKTLPQNIHRLISMTSSTGGDILKAVIEGQLGETEASDKLYKLIYEDLQMLNPKKVVSNTSNNNLPLPNDLILDEMFNKIQSDTDVDDLFTTYPTDDLLNTLYTLMQPDSQSKLINVDSLIKYYNNCARTFEKLDKSMQKTIIKNIVTLIQADAVNKALIEHITDDTSGALSTKLSNIINAII